MRLIDRLITPPPDKYILLPNRFSLSFTLPKRRKTKNVFTFYADTTFYRILSFNHDYKTLIEPVEKTYVEEVPLEDKLMEISDYVNRIKEKIPLKNLSFGTYIPSQQGLLRLYTFPGNLKKKEVLQALSLYIQQEIAETYREKNVIYSYAFLDRKGDEPYRVLVAIVEKEPIDMLLSWAESLGIHLDIISYEPTCLINLGFLKNLPQPFSILYTDLNKILLLSFQKDRILYEVFPYLFSTESTFEDTLNMLIWDIRNYIVLNDLTNLFLAGIVVEYEHITQYFLERLPIFGIISINKFPDRYSLLYTLGERLLNV